MKETILWLLNFCFVAIGGFGLEALQVSQSEFVLVEKLWDFVAPLGVAISVLFFLVEINKTMMMEGNNMTLKSLGNPLLKLVISFAFIQYGIQIIGDFVNFGNAFLVWATNFDISGSTSVADMAQQVADASNIFTADGWDLITGEMSFWGLLCMLSASLLYFAASILVSLIIEFKCLTLKLEVLLRIGLAPLVIGDVYEGKNSASVRYLKKILACFTYGAGMLIVLKLGEGIMSATFDVSALSNAADVVSAGGDALWMMIKQILYPIIINIAVIASFGMIQRTSNDVWGVIN